MRKTVISAGVMIITVFCFCHAACADLSVKEEQNKIMIANKYYSVTFDKSRGGTITQLGEAAVEQLDGAESYAVSNDSKPDIVLTKSPEKADLVVKAYYLTKDGAKAPSGLRAEYRYTFHADSPVVGCKATLKQDQVVLYADVSVFPRWTKVGVLQLGGKSGFYKRFSEEKKDIQIFLKPGEKDIFDVSKPESDDFAKKTFPDVGRGEHLLAEEFQDNNRWTNVSGTWIWAEHKLSETSLAAQWSWTVAGERFWKDYIVEADVLSQGESHTYVCARWQDAGNHYEIEYIEWPVYCIRINCVVEGKRLKLAEVMDVPDLTKQPSTHLALAVNGSQLKAYKDGELILEACDSTFSQGRIALGSANTYPVSFLAVDVYALKKEADVAPAIQISQAIPSRHAFYREEKDAIVKFLVSSDKPANGLTARFILREDLWPVHGELQRQVVNLEELKSNQKYEVGYTLSPASWRSGDYSLDIEVCDDFRILARDTVKIFLRRRPNPERFLISSFYGNDAENIAELGFNEFQIAADGVQTRWSDGKWGRTDDPLRLQNNPELLQTIYDRFDDCVRYGVWGFINMDYTLLVPNEIPESFALKRDGSGVQDHLENGNPAGRPHVNPWHPAVISRLQDYYSKSVQAYQDLPAWHSAHLSGESDNVNEVYGNDYWLAMARKELGFAVPEDVYDKLGPKGRALPQNGIVEDDDPYYRFYRWWWKRGAGYGMRHAAVSETIKKARPDVVTLHEPALRQPFVAGQFAGVDMIEQWPYCWPNVARMALEADELKLAAVGGQKSSLMFQLFAWGDVAIPRSSGLPWPYVKRLDYHLAHSPAIMREAVWLAFSRGLGGIAFDGLAVGDAKATDRIFPSPKGDVRAEARGFGYHYLLYANPDLVSAVKELNFNVLQPYGLMTKHLVSPKAEVVFLLPNATAMLARKDAESFRVAEAGVLYSKLQAAHVPVEVMYEETLEEKGLQGYKAIALPGCLVLSRHIYDLIKKFAESGGLVIADEYLVPEFPNVARFPMGFNPWGKEAQQQEATLKAAADVRKALDGKITRWSDCDSASVALHELENGSSRLLFVINNLRRGGDYVGRWEQVLDDGVAQRIKVRIRPKDKDVVIYDILARSLVRPQPDGAWLVWAVDLEPGEGRMFAVMPEEIGTITVNVPDKVKKSTNTTVKIEVLGAKGKPFAGLVPLQVTIKDSQGIGNDYSDYYLSADGKVTFALPIAKNDPSGDWSVLVQELFSAKTGKAFFTVAVPEKVAQAEQPLSGLVPVPEMWLFRTDPEKVGAKEKWFVPGGKDKNWRLISTHKFWDSALGGVPYVGDGWYAVDLTIPAPPGKKVLMVFGAVDENYTLWINGQYLGNNLDAGTALWDKPVEIDITGRYKPGESNHIVVRVKNTEAAGGIWKPVQITAE